MHTVGRFLYLRPALAALAFLLIGNVAASGQAGMAELTATVTDDDGVPIAGAAVWVGQLSALTDVKGRATLTRIPAGAHLARIRADGYETESVMVQFEAGAVVEFDAQLKVAAGVVSLPVISVEAERQIPSLRVAGFYQRKQAAHGVFMEREQLVRSDYLPEVALLFRQVRGFDAVWTCGSGGLGCRYAIRSSRGPTGFGGCTPTTIVDGIIWHPDQLNSLRVFDIEAVEAYSGPATTPPQFMLDARGTSCGTVVFWTRRGERS